MRPTVFAPSLIAAIVQQVVAQFDLPPWRPQIGFSKAHQGEQLAVKYDHMVTTFPET